MAWFRMSSAAVIVFIFVLLPSYGEAARVLSAGSSDPPSSSSVKHDDKVAAALHVRKPPNNITSAAGGGGGAKKKTAAWGSMEDDDGTTVVVPAPSDCSMEVVVVSQGKEGPMPGGIPSYSVTITNTCLDCTVRDVHVACGEFASTELVSPSDFRRLAVGDCLVRDGGPMAPGDTVDFEYANSFPYDLQVASVTCV